MGKYYLSILLGFSGMWSTTSSSVYFPTIPTISREFNVSTSLSNIAVVVYLIFQALGPGFIAPLSDTYGRRPFVLFSLLCSCSVCIAISQTSVYWLMLVLRCLQTFFIAPIVSISSGIIGDICIRSERGSFLGIVTGLVIVGQGFGALVGAALISRWGWRGIFVALAIGSGAMIPSVLIFLPETNRNIVGNMSINPSNTIYKPPVICTKKFRAKMINAQSTLALSNTKKSDLFGQLNILRNRIVILILLSSGLQFSTWTMTLTSLSTTLENDYNYSIIKVGLCYISPGMGSLIGSLISGKLIDRNYRILFNKFCLNYESIP